MASIGLTACRLNWNGPGAPGQLVGHQELTVARAVQPAHTAELQRRSASSPGAWPLAPGTTDWRTLDACARVSPNRAISWFCDSGFAAATDAASAAAAAVSASAG